MIGPTDLLHPSPAPHFKTSQVFLICPKRPSFSTWTRRAADQKNLESFEIPQHNPYQMTQRHISEDGRYFSQSLLLEP